MTALADRRGRLLASLYKSYGEPADWTPAGGGGSSRIVVRRAQADEVGNFGDSRAVLEALPLLARVSEMARPAKNDVLVLNPGPAEETVQLIAAPRRTRFGGEWLLEAARI